MTDQEKHRNAVEYAQIAKLISPMVGLPVRALVAQWAIESAWGASKSGDYNFWGITWNPRIHTGKKWCVTREDLTQHQIDTWMREDEKKTIEKIALVKPGVWRCRMNRWFASFRDADEAVESYRKLLNLSRYAPVRKVAEKDPMDMIAIGAMLKECGYATAHNYAETFRAVANSSRLQRALDEAGV